MINDAETCEVLDLFSSIFVDEGYSPVPEFTSEFSSELKNVNITEDEMYKLLYKLNTSKAPGPDTIHPKIIKECSRELAHSLRLSFLKTW